MPLPTKGTTKVLGRGQVYLEESANPTFLHQNQTSNPQKMTSKFCPPPPNTAEEGKQGTQPHGATVSSGCDPGEQGKGAQASPQDACK